MLDTIISLCKRRGFVFQSCEIYGGVGSIWDYGPLGVLLKNNIRNLWKKEYKDRGDMEEIESSLLTKKEVWIASQHIQNFHDILVECKSCNHRFRIEDDEVSKECPNCKGKDLSEPRKFNLMFKTFIGPVEDEGSVAYLRPETAQGIYLNFSNVQSAMRRKLPFGIYQTGKSFRNEITSRFFIFRTREFEQMEMQYFCHASEREKHFETLLESRFEWYKKIGFKDENIRIKEHPKDKLAHYANRACDVEAKFPMGFAEVEGIHDRGDFDLKNHMDLSKKNLTYFDEVRNESYIPNVVETSAGCDRIFLALLTNAYCEEPERVVLKFSPKVAPIKLGIFPLIKNPDLENIANKIYDSVKNDYMAFYDEKGSIGRRYRRQDEIGTPCCITVDFDSLKDDSVTIRERDTMTQDRINVSKVFEYLSAKGLKEV